MDVFESFTSGNRSLQIRAIGMHTAGEPTRIIIQGFPSLAGRTLLEKRADAKAHHDDVRRRLMHEPRGHNDMYGAILIQATELVESGEADIGVLFCHNEGFSTMCGHATLALGRVLVDTHDITIFPRRGLLRLDPSQNRTSLTVHAPCGPVHVSVPVVFTDTGGSNQTDMKSDPSRSVWFLSVPSFATAIDLVLHIPSAYCWPELTASGSQDVTIDIAFGGAFYAFVSVRALGFPSESLDVGLENGSYSLASLTEATRLLKKYLTESPESKTLLRHPTSPELEYLYGVIVTDPPMVTVSGSSPKPSEIRQSGMNICFFAEQQIDRSPCGSGVSARVALAIAKGERELEDPWTYHSLITKRNGGDAFTARGVKHVLLNHDNRHVEKGKKWEAVIVKVEGKAYYTDAATFVLEQGDSISKDGFMLQ